MPDGRGNCVCEYLYPVCKGVTICTIEHNLDIVQGISDRIAVLVVKAGAIIPDAAPDEIKDNARLMELY